MATPTKQIQILHDLDDLAILRESGRAEARVLAEAGAEAGAKAETLPAGYVRPMSCHLGAPASAGPSDGPSAQRDLSIALAIASREAPVITTDDAPIIAQIVDAINETPHRFAEEFLMLVRRVDQLETLMRAREDRRERNEWLESFQEGVR